MTINAPYHRTKPSHPDLIGLGTGEEGLHVLPADYATRAISLQTLAPNAFFANITGITLSAERTYATVQKSRSKNINLNSDLLFINHSCDPNLVFDLTRMEVRVVPHKTIHVGDELTWFYPSSEWDMAQEFECNCGSRGCFGVIRGSRYMARRALNKYELNQHIVELLDERDAVRS